VADVQKAKLLLPQSDKKHRAAEPLPQLETPEQIRRSLQRDHALGVRARRIQEESRARAEELAVDRARFALTREKVYFGLEIFFLVLIVALLWLYGNTVLALLVLAGGAGFRGLAPIFHR
jgi:hypothetical protein